MKHMKLKTDEERLVAQVVDACRNAITRAIAAPSEALGIAQGLDASLSTLKLVAQETAKGENGLPHIVDAREALSRDALTRVLRLASDHEAARAALGAVDTVAPVPARSTDSPAGHPVTPSRRDGIPTFAEVSQAYIDMRIGSSDEKHKEIVYLRLRRRTFLEIIGDKPVDAYTHKDLQDYVNAMRYWPANATKRGEWSDRSVGEILADNRDLHLKPLSRKTLNGYVSHIRTMMRYMMNDCSYRDPFQGARPRYPATARPSVTRQEIPPEVLQRAFERGIASGCIDEAMLPPLAALTARRIGLLIYLRGTDIREKGGVMIAETQGIVLVNGVWQRVPYKTDESIGFFVLHDLFRDAGWTDWAMTREDQWLFPQLHEYPDPAKQASKLMNRL